ncbi:hypothetical protein ACJMK2_040991 [Sinanodonta woodiana]|uniref:Uncharacterized protein n=1 Tax=Sinanodonta woodiana TaxID=1069815 RepID=A0ABD3W2P9_SINWO
MSLKFRQALKQTLLRKSCCHKPPRPKKRSYFSYKFAHRNGYSETSFTSVEPAPHAGVARGGNHSASDTDQRPHSSGSGTRQGSPAHSNGGGSVKNMEEQTRSSKRDNNSMLHIKCYDKNCNKADMFVGLCGRLEFSYGSSKPLCHLSDSTK